MSKFSVFEKIKRNFNCFRHSLQHKGHRHNTNKHTSRRQISLTTTPPVWLRHSFRCTTPYDRIQDLQRTPAVLDEQNFVFFCRGNASTALRRVLDWTKTWHARETDDILPARFFAPVRSQSSSWRSLATSQAERRSSMLGGIQCPCSDKSAITSRNCASNRSLI